MGRSHAWVQRGAVVVDPRPMHWGDNLTMIGAIRANRWLTMRTSWQTANADRFVAWVAGGLAPRLRPGDIVVLDNLGAHKDRRVRQLIEQRGATLQFLPPPLPGSESDRGRVGLDQEAHPVHRSTLWPRLAPHRPTRVAGHPPTTLSKLVRPCRLLLVTQLIFGVSGITRSIRTTSMFRARSWYSATHSLPSTTQMTLYPKASSILCVTSRTSASSSATRTSRRRSMKSVTMSRLRWPNSRHSLSDVPGTVQTVLRRTSEEWSV